MHEAKHGHGDFIAVGLKMRPFNRQSLCTPCFVLPPALTGFNFTHQMCCLSKSTDKTRVAESLEIELYA